MIKTDYQMREKWNALTKHEAVTKDQKYNGWWEAEEGADTLNMLSDYDPNKEYYSGSRPWDNFGKHEVECDTSINLRRKPTVNITFGFAVDAIGEKYGKLLTDSRVCGKMDRKDAVDISKDEIMEMLEREAQPGHRKYKLGDIVPRWRLVRNIFVDVLDAKWPDYDSMVEEAGR